MHPNYIVFDFDGTIMESAPGITRSVRHALVTLGFPEPDEETLLKFIGPPLHPAFREFGGLSYEQAEEAVRVYRERYGAIGLFEARVYPGVAPLLRALKADGRYVAVASSKPDALVKRIAEHFGLTKYFDRIIGADPESHSSDKMCIRDRDKIAHLKAYESIETGVEIGVLDGTDEIEAFIARWNMKEASL